MATLPITQTETEIAGGPSSSRVKRNIAEFILVGGITPILYLASWLLRGAIPLDDAQLAVGFLFFYGAFVINDPHFAVTYVLFYEDVRARLFGNAFSRGMRIRYWIAGFIFPLALFIWGLTSVIIQSPYAVGLMIQLMFFLVGWHYVKQGFGVMMVLSGRRGVRYSSFERYVILAHGLLGWAYAWAEPYDPGREVIQKGLIYTTIRHPRGLEATTHVLFLLSFVALIAVLIRKRIREKKLPITTPLIAFLSSIWAWSIYSNIDPLVVFIVPALHSIQYLYFVWLLKTGEGREREGPPHFEVSAKTRIGILVVSSLALGWIFFHGAPTAFDDMLTKRTSRFTDMGPTPYFAALYAFVNIHHYVMDGVIWRRDNPRTRYLFVQ